MDLVFLTRQGCVNTPQMMRNLDAARKALGWPLLYQCVDIGNLPHDDARAGYPTPTLLYKGRDLFGLAVPQPPHVPS